MSRPVHSAHQMVQLVKVLKALSTPAKLQQQIQEAGGDSELRRLISTLVLIFFFPFFNPLVVANADSGGSCSQIKLGLDYIPKSPEDLLDTDSRYKISETKIEGLRAGYNSDSEIALSWSRWPIFDQATETLFYDSYVVYYSENQGQTWKCSTISAALITFNLGGLKKDTDYEFALSATDGSVWAPPTYFSGSTNLSKRPKLQLCIPERFSPSLNSVVGNLLLITTNEPFGNNLPLKWTYSENNWKSFKTYKSPTWGIFTRFEEPVFIPFTKNAKYVEVKVTPSAEKINKRDYSIAYSGYTSRGCKAQTFKIDLKKKTLVRR